MKDFIRNRRKALGLTQAELAARASITEAHLNDLEQRCWEASSDLIPRLASALGVHLDDMYYVFGRIAPDLLGRDPFSVDVQTGLSALRSRLQERPGVKPVWCVECGAGGTLRRGLCESCYYRSRAGVCQVCKGGMGKKRLGQVGVCGNCLRRKKQ